MEHPLRLKTVCHLATVYRNTVNVLSTATSHLTQNMYSVVC